MHSAAGFDDFQHFSSDQNAVMRYVTDRTSLFNEINIDGSESGITRKELSMYVNYIRHTAEDDSTETLFKTLDLDKDGRLSDSEINQLKLEDYEIKKEDLEKRILGVSLSGSTSRENTKINKYEFAAILYPLKFPYVIHLRALEIIKELPVHIKDTLLFELVENSNITKDEYKKLNLSDRFERLLDFNKIDINHDNVLELAELQRLLFDGKKSSIEAKLFNELDTTGDSFLSTTEFTAPKANDVIYRTFLQLLQERDVAEPLLRRCINYAEMDRYCKAVTEKLEPWQSKRPPLTYASARGFPEVVKKILSFPVAFGKNNETDVHNNSPLLLATWENHLDVVDILVKEKKVVWMINHKNRDNMAPLHYATMRNQSGAVEKLLKSVEIDVNISNCPDGANNCQSDDLKRKSMDSTPLMFAAAGGYQQIFDMLINYENIDHNLTNVNGETALMQAASWNRTEIVRSYLKVIQATNSDLCNKQDEVHKLTAMMYAAYEGLYDVIKIMLDFDKTCRTDITNVFDWTAADVAYFAKIDDTVKKQIRQAFKAHDGVAPPVSWTLWMKDFSVRNFYSWLLLFNGIIPFAVVIYIYYVDYVTRRNEKEKNVQTSSLAGMPETEMSPLKSSTDTTTL